jgi:nucleoside-triphosphatase THEP1
MTDVEPTGHLIILSGPRSSGKTTLIQKVLERLSDQAIDMAGILSLPVEENGKKIAIDGLDIRSGEVRRLANRNPGLSGDLATQQWLFEPRAMQWADGILDISTPCDLLVVDELGVLEFERGRGWLAGLKALDDGLFSVAIVVIRPELLKQAQARWPGSGYLEVTPDNRAVVLNDLEKTTAAFLRSSSHQGAGD